MKKILLFILLFTSLSFAQFVRRPDSTVVFATPTQLRNYVLKSDSNKYGGYASYNYLKTTYTTSSGITTLLGAKLDTASAGYLKRLQWDLAYTRSGKIVADTTNWNTAYSNSHTHSNKAILDSTTTAFTLPLLGKINTTYGWGNHANAGYLTSSSTAATPQFSQLGLGRAISASWSLALQSGMTTKSGTYIDWEGGNARIRENSYALEFSTYNGSSLTTKLTISGAGLFTFFDGGTWNLGTTTGTKIGTATNQKIGFFNSTPIVQPSGNALTALSNLGLVASPTLTSTDVGLGNVPNTDATNPANISQTSSYRFVTDTEKSTWNSLTGNATKFRGIDLSLGTATNGKIYVYRADSTKWVLEDKPAGGTDPDSSKYATRYWSNQTFLTSSALTPYLLKSDSLTKWISLTQFNSGLSGKQNTLTYTPANEDSVYHKWQTYTKNEITASVVGNTVPQWNANKLRGIDLSLGGATDGKIYVYRADSTKWVLEDKPAGGGASDTTVYATKAFVTKAFTGSAAITTLGTISSGTWDAKLNKADSTVITGYTTKTQHNTKLNLADSTGNGYATRNYARTTFAVNKAKLDSITARAYDLNLVTPTFISNSHTHANKAKLDSLSGSASKLNRIGNLTDGNGVLTNTSGVLSWGASSGGGALMGTSASDFTTTSSSYVDCTGYSVNVEANSTYSFTANLRWYDSGSNNSIGYPQFSVPSGTVISGVITNYNESTQVMYMLSGFIDQFSSYANPAGLGSIVTITGKVVTSSTAGAFKLQLKRTSGSDGITLTNNSQFTLIKKQ